MGMQQLGRKVALGVAVVLTLVSPTPFTWQRPGY